MTARPVLLTADEHAELDRRLVECESDTALRQYIAAGIVLEQLLAATRAKSLRRIKTTLLRLARPSFAAEFAGAANTSEPPPLGQERLL